MSETAPELPEVKTDVRALGDLTPADYNPRTITEEALTGLRESLRRFGLVQDIVWNQRSGNIVGGHQRWQVMMADFGEDYEIEVKVVDLDDIQEKALNVALNNPHVAGEFTPGVVDLIKEIQASDLGALLTPGLRLDELLPVNDMSFLDDVGDDGDDSSPSDGEDEEGGGGGDRPPTEHVDFVVPLNPNQNTLVYETIRAVKKALRDDGGANVDTAEALVHLCENWKS